MACAWGAGIKPHCDRLIPLVPQSKIRLWYLHQSWIISCITSWCSVTSRWINAKCCPFPRDAWVYSNGSQLCMDDSIRCTESPHTITNEPNSRNKRNSSKRNSSKGKVSNWRLVMLVQSWYWKWKEPGPVICRPLISGPKFFIQWCHCQKFTWTGAKDYHEAFSCSLKRKQASLRRSMSLKHEGGSRDVCLLHPGISHVVSCIPTSRGVHAYIPSPVTLSESSDRISFELQQDWNW